MRTNPQVPLHRLVLSLADAMDCVHKEISNHQIRVAYGSTHIARSMGIEGQALLDVFLAAAFHDIGLVRADNRLLALHLGRLEELRWHGECGYQLLRDQPLLAAAALSVRYHHLPWAHGRGGQHDGQEVPLASHIIQLADEVDRLIDRDAPILRQQPSIRDRLVSLRGSRLHPRCVEAFEALADSEAFWLDWVSDRIYGVLLNQVDWPTPTLDESIIKPIAEVFALIVDAGSRWTATHSAGVTAVAVALSERLGFSAHEQALMRAAGYLHDLGKLTIPSAILDKPQRLTADESLCMKQHVYHTFRILDTIGGLPQIAQWAAFHHERLDGRGYPFRHGGGDLTLGSRIMAVADVFTAVTEDRPYRRGMPKPESLAVLDKLVANGGIDGDVVGVLRAGFDDIDAICRQEQAQYIQRQERLARHFAGTPMLGKQRGR